MTAILIATVHLRTVSSRVFYRFRTAVVARDRIKQQLWQKQIQLESLINPSAISEYLEQDQDHEQ